jgi:hypothetical protein
MVLGGWYSDVRFYTNVGTNPSPVFNSYIYLVMPDSQAYLNGNPPRINFTDWDGDSDLDMITCDYYGSVFLRENITPSYIEEHNVSMPGANTFRISPNPAANVVIATAFLSDPGFLRIDLYSVDGRLIATPVQRVIDAGEHDITWNLYAYDQQEMPNGVYIVKLTTNTAVLSEKIVVIR